MKILLKTLLLLLLIIIQPNQKNNLDYVPNAETAIKIAEAIWLPIYGDKVLNKKPFIATLNQDGKVWIVKGSISEDVLGGYPIIEIQKSDCKILKVSHSK
ncbi:YbbC/YhhH family protein [Capnocytophaga sp. ARDL2]|uniref:YbbC/YhhH family protein n=1 Tax=Capnocytophaga sp. ARDL2 TaxID=3238809 RepID=UPI003557F947